MAYNTTLNHFTSMQELATLWASGSSYVTNQLVIFNNAIYRCLVSHISSVSFSSDYSGGNWADIGISGFIDVSISGTDINWAQGITFYKTITSNTVFTFSNASNGKMVTIIITNSSGSDVTATFPSAKVSGILPTTVAAGKANIYTAIQSNGQIYMTAATDFA